MKLFFKIIGGLFLLFLVASAVMAAMNWQMVMQIVRYNPLVIPAMYGEPADLQEANEQDLKFARKLLKYDRSFSDEAETKFLTQLDALNEQAATLSKAELYLGVARAVAHADNGHTNLSTYPLYSEFNHANVKFFWFADGLYIVRAHNMYADLVGARVTGIGNKTPEEIVGSLSQYLGGAANFRRLYATFHLESPQMMHAAGLAASPDALQLTVIDRTGQERDVALAAVSRDASLDVPGRRPFVTLQAIPMDGEGDDWTRTLNLTGSDAPLYLRNSDENFFWTKLDNSGVYIRPQLLLNRDDAVLVEQFEEVLGAFSDGELGYMVVDLRWSPGGDYTQVIDFVKSAPEKLSADGRLYIVTGPQTFSAAIVMTAFLKYYGGEKSVIIGEQNGDREQFWAERGPLPFELPNSGFSINYSTGYHDWANGCADRHEYCFTQNIIHEVPAGSLAPDVMIAPTFADYASGGDLIMNYILSAQAPPDQESD
ncbi:hypothetical protein PUV54_15060 [Hyphococcus flavus]|uniref:Tail specific protease domain-containing protein n=1 Tax=Hyphococcus flavus TaxID=1866326 RepID=A0AAE9ZB28_9PROT|nr:hypothetical protein [Hyphococcus flavus]WDI31269.1 hypothetical protein PUV54_15060 [Hyphococcus flavus]